MCRQTISIQANIFSDSNQCLCVERTSLLASITDRFNLVTFNYDKTIGNCCNKTCWNFYRNCHCKSKPITKCLKSTCSKTPRRCTRYTSGHSAIREGFRRTDTRWPLTRLRRRTASITKSTEQSFKCHSSLLGDRNSLSGTCTSLWYLRLLCCIST